MKLFTIGFTKTSAEGFFERIKRAGVRNVIDVRLNNVSQLAGFAKRDDLRFFSKELCGAGYQHRPELAPTKEMLDGYKKLGGSWGEYEHKFLDLMAKRKIEQIEQSDLESGCLLCSEDRPHHCHRKLVAEYLRDRWGNVEIIHL